MANYTQPNKKKRKSKSSSPSTAQLNKNYNLPFQIESITNKIPNIYKDIAENNSFDSYDKLQPKVDSLIEKHSTNIPDEIHNFLNVVEKTRQHRKDILSYFAIVEKHNDAIKRRKAYNVNVLSWILLIFCILIFVPIILAGLLASIFMLITSIIYLVGIFDEPTQIIFEKILAYLPLKDWNILFLYIGVPVSLCIGLGALFALKFIHSSLDVSTKLHCPSKKLCICLANEIATLRTNIIEKVNNIKSLPTYTPKYDDLLFIEQLIREEKAREQARIAENRRIQLEKERALAEKARLEKENTPTPPKDLWLQKLLNPDVIFCDHCGWRHDRSKWTYIRACTRCDSSMKYELYYGTVYCYCPTCGSSNFYYKCPVCGKPI